MHPEAIKNFNKNAEELVDLVKSQQAQKPRKTDSQKGYFTSHTIIEKDIIGEISINLTNAFRDDLGYLFQVEQRDYGITGSDYAELKKCAERIQKDKTFNTTSSVNFVIENLKKWIRNRYENKEEKDFISFLKSILDSSIKKYQVWVPIPFTSIENDFSIGNVKIRTISKSIIDLWIRIDANKIDIDTLSKIEKFKAKIQQEYQGYAAAVYECEAEPIRAQEIAIDYISDALSMLRLFSPGNFSTRLVSGMYEYGKSLIETKNLFLFDSVNLGFSQTSKLLDHGMYWTIPSYIICNPVMSGFNKILLIKGKNEFQKKVYEALKIYSKHTLRRNPFDKLLYILISLESILLRNETEPVQQNLAERIAFAIEKTNKERKKIVKTIKKIYSIRSKFVHHGDQTIEESEELDKFLNIAWRMFVLLTQNINSFKTKDEFITALEDLKFS